MFKLGDRIVCTKRIGTFKVGDIRIIKQHPTNNTMTYIQDHPNLNNGMGIWVTNGVSFNNGLELYYKLCGPIKPKPSWM